MIDERIVDPIEDEDGDDYEEEWSFEDLHGYEPEEEPEEFAELYGEAALREVGMSYRDFYEPYRG